MRPYEIMTIFRSTEIEGEDGYNEAVDKLVNLLEQNGGAIANIDKWGKRRLAYEVQDTTEGFYVVIRFEAEPTAVHEVERVLRLTHDVLRHIVIRLDEE